MTTRTQHTPGPWVLGTQSRTWMIAFAEGAGCRSLTVAKAMPLHGDKGGREQGDFEVEKANARLIAAAPDLLQAAKCALADLEGFAFDTVDLESDEPVALTVRELRAALAKATRN